MGGDVRGTTVDVSVLGVVNGGEGDEVPSARLVSCRVSVTVRRSEENNVTHSNG